MTTSSLLGRQGELLAQLRDLLILPSSSSSSPPASKQLVSAVGPLAGAAGPGPPPTAVAVPSTAMASGRRRRRRESRKRGRGDEVTTNGEDPVAAAAAASRPRCHYCKRSTSRKQVQRSGTSMVVASAPDLFDGYQWRKYGQKLIEGAMYPRSYYRCARSAEQGCAAKRTVQRNDDADDAGSAVAATATAPMYTVVRVGEHTCTANDDSPDQAPVILETTAVVAVPGATSNSSTVPASSSPAAASCSTTTAGTESPAIVSDRTLNSSSIIASSECHCYAADHCHGLLAAAVHDNNDWVPGPAASSSPMSFPGIEDFAGPIRSPVHVSAEDVWMFDQFLQLQFVNDPAAICQHV